MRLLLDYLLILGVIFPALSLMTGIASLLLRGLHPIEITPVAKLIFGNGNRPALGVLGAPHLGDRRPPTRAGGTPAQL